MRFTLGARIRSELQSRQGAWIRRTPRRRAVLLRAGLPGLLHVLPSAIDLLVLLPELWGVLPNGAELSGGMDPGARVVRGRSGRSVTGALAGSRLSCVAANEAIGVITSHVDKTCDGECAAGTWAFSRKNRTVAYAAFTCRSGRACPWMPPSFRCTPSQPRVIRRSGACSIKVGRVGGIGPKMQRWT